LQASLQGLEAQTLAWAEARDLWIEGLQKLWPGLAIHGGEVALANTLSVSFVGLENDTLLLKLDQLGLQASAGSACAAGASEPSHVLAAMGLGPRYLQSVIRFSLGADQGLPEAQEALKRVAQALTDLKAAGLIPA
jgi:cysteine desulfurase